MGVYVLDFQEVDQTQIAVVGGKGAHLGELSRVKGLRVPAGFCVTTDAFQRIMAEAPSIDDQLDRRPISKRATSWSPPSPIRAGLLCSSRSKAW